MFIDSDTQGPVILKSNSVLTVREDALVMSSANLDTCFQVGKSYRDTCNNEVCRAFIGAKDKENIQIFAKKNGIINGQGVLWNDSTDFAKRPHVIRLVGCKNVHIHDLVIVDAPSCAISIFNCENVVIENVSISSKWGCNNDGIDVDSCKNVTIRNCEIDTGDDCISVKSTSIAECREVTIENCRLISEISAFKIGTESVGHISSICFRNSHIENCKFSAIKIVPTDGGLVNGVEISNIQLVNVTGPIFIANGERNKVYHENEWAGQRSSISNVKISGVCGNVVVSLSKICTPINGCVVASGSVNHKIKNLVIENCDLVMPGGGTKRAEFFVEEMRKQYPEFYSLGGFPASCMYLRHVDGVTLKNNTFSLTEIDERDKFVFDDVLGIETDDKEINLGK